MLDHIIKPVALEFTKTHYMKKHLLLLTFAAMFGCIQETQSQISTRTGGAAGVIANAPTNNTNVGINNTDPCFPLDVVGRGYHMNGYSFDRCIRVKGGFQGGNPKSGNILFDGSNVNGVTQNFLIGGPGNTGGVNGSLGCYYFMLQSINTDSCPGGQAGIFAAKVYGTDIANEPGAGSFQFYRNVILSNTNNDGRLGISTRFPERQLHIMNGSALITASMTSNEGLLFKSSTNVNLSNFGDWGLQYWDNTSGGGKRGLNFWKPSGGVYGTSANNILFLADDNNVGVRTSNPSALFHVDATGYSATTALRFEGLTQQTQTQVLMIDANGYVTRQTANPIALSSCSNFNYLPRVTAANTLTCGQVFDNASVVSIGFTNTYNTTAGSFNYSTNPQLQGSTTAPSSGTVRLDVNGVTRSLAFLATSDAKMKTDIKDIKGSLGKIMALQGKSYLWNDKARKEYNADNGVQLGFIAQEVEKILPEAIAKDGQGNYAVNYNMIIPVLTEAVKELNAKIEDNTLLKTELETLKLENEKLKAKTEEIERLVSAICADGCDKAHINLSENSDVSYLFQNAPNPFDKSTTIKYKLAKSIRSAYIVVNDLNGNKLKTYNLDIATNGSVQVGVSDLTSGTYTYTLVADSKIIDTKLMVVTK